MTDSQNPQDQNPSDIPPQEPGNAAADAQQNIEEFADEADASREEIALYAFGNIENALAGQFYNIMNAILIMSMGVSPLLIGLVLGLKTLVDAVTDPIMAHITDNAKTRWGRRRPFILGGGVGRIVFLVLVMLMIPDSDKIMPNAEKKAQEEAEALVIQQEKEAREAAIAAGEILPEEEKEPEKIELKKTKKSSKQKIVEGWAAFQSEENADQKNIVYWMLIAFLGFTVLTTIMSVPYYALGIEIAPSYDGRTRVVTYRSIMDKIAGLAGPWVLPFCYLTIFYDVREGLFWYAVITAVIGIPSTVLMVMFTKERTRISMDKKGKNKLGIFASITETLKNWHFVKILILYKFFGFSIGIFAQFGLFLNVYWVFGGDKLAGSVMGGKVGTLGWGLAFAALPLVNWMCRRYQKHITLRFAVTLMGIGSILKWWCMNPEHPEYQYILPFFFSIGISSLYTVLGTMMADVTDIDELRTGQRREGMFGAVMALMSKLIGAFQPIIAGLMLELSGFNAELGAGQTEETIFKMRWMYSLVPGVLCLLGLLLLIRYPLTRQRMAEVKEELKKRRAAAAAAA